MAAFYADENFRLTEPWPLRSRVSAGWQASSGRIAEDVQPRGCRKGMSLGLDPASEQCQHPFCCFLRGRWGLT